MFALEQLQKLKDLLFKPHDEKEEDKDLEGNYKDSGSGFRNTNSKSETMTSLQEGLEDRGVMNTTNYIEELRHEEGYELLNTSQQQVDASLTSLESLYRFDPISILDQQRGNSQWSNFWN